MNDNKRYVLKLGYDKYISFQNNKKYNKIVYLNIIKCNESDHFRKCKKYQNYNLIKLPIKLKHLFCEEIHINNLPELSNCLENLNCSRNQLIYLPKLPYTLIDFNCCKNQLIDLPKLNECINLIFITFYNNKIKKISYFPQKTIMGSLSFEILKFYKIKCKRRMSAMSTIITMIKLKYLLNIYLLYI